MANIKGDNNNPKWDESKNVIAQKSSDVDDVRNSEEKFRQIYVYMREGLAIYEMIYDQSGKAIDYRIIDVNPAFEAITGISKEVACGQLTSILYQNPIASYLEVYDRVMQTGDPETFEAYFEQIKKHFQISAFRINSRSFATLYSDITERKTAETKSAYLASFPELNPMIIVEINRKGEVTYLNPSAKKAFPDLVTLNVSHPYLIDHKEALDSGLSHDYLAHPYEKRVGDRYFLQNLYEVKTNQNIRIYGMDITEVRKAETIIQKQNAILRSIIESPNTPIFSVDLNYRYSSFNTSHAAVMKSLYNVDIELGKSILDYHTITQDRESAKKNMDMVFQGKSFTVESWAGDSELSRRYFEISHNPVRGSDDQIIGAAIFVKDATERKNIEEKLIRSKNELEERVKERTSDLQVANDFLSSEIAARKLAEYQLSERLKELQCLYQINSLDDEVGLDSKNLLKRVISIIPLGYRYPGYVCVKITINGEIYQTPNWENSSQKQISDIKAEGSALGRIEVVYNTSFFQTENMLFIKEEQQMLDAIGELLGSIIRRRSSESELIKNRERLSLAIQVSGAGIYEFSTYPESYYCSERFAEIIGYELAELPKAGHFMSWFIKQIHVEDRHLVLKAFKNNVQHSEQNFDASFRMKHKSGEWKYVHCISASSVSEVNTNISYHTSGIMLDVTETQQTERRILLNNEIMKLFWESANIKDYLSEVVDLIQRWCRCDCIGVRLLDSITATIPYIAYKGFDDDFIKLEGSLSMKNNNCACVRIIANKLESQDDRVLTPSGSLYMSNSMEFYTRLPEEVKARYRGICIQSGFQTIVIIPIRHRQIIFGAIHIADKNVSALSIKEIETLEQVAALIGQGLYRFDIENRIKTSQIQLANAQKIAHLGDWDWDLRSNTLNWSDEVYSLFGKRPQGFQATYQKFISFIYREDRNLVEKAIDAALYHEQPFNIEHRILLSDGTVGFVHQQALVTYDTSGQPLKMTGTIQDITARKTMEKQVLETSNYARTLIEVSLDPLMTINSDGKIMDVNKATESATGFDRKQLIGTDFANYFSEPEKARDGYKRVFSDGYVRDYPLVLKNNNGNMIDVLYNASLYRNSSGEIQGVFASARDITQLKKIEEELHALSKQIVTAQENERRVIARELHDEIGQSLTALKILVGQAGRLTEEKRQSSLIDAYNLASDLLQQVRELSLKLRPSMLDDLGLLPALIWHFDKFTAQTGIRINFEHEGLEKFLSQEVSTTVYRIIQEALTNVVRYAGVKEVNVIVLFNSDKLFITIEDKGRGFSLPETNVRATAGLSGMRERVLLLGGKMILDTEPQKGTRISVELPISGKADLAKKW